MIGARGWNAFVRPARSGWTRGVPLLVPALILVACTDEIGVTPPDASFAAGPASKEFVITTTKDTEECGSPPGECSLRGALLAANDDPEGGPYTIVLQAGETYTLTDTDSDGLPVYTGVVMQGNGATIERDGVGRVIEVRDSLEQGLAELTLEEVTVSGGNATGRVSLGGGIAVRDAALTLSNSTVQGNVAVDAGGISAINSTVILTNSTVSDNRADFDGGISADRGSDVTLANSTVSDNRASSGGGISANGGSALTLTNSVVSGNVVEPSFILEGLFSGGGIAIRRDARLTLRGSTVNNNTIEAVEGEGRGAGIYVSQRGGGLIVNTTVSGNIVNGRSRGVGIYANRGEDIAVINSTVADNGSSDDGPGVYLANGEVVLSNTIVANQQFGPDCGTGTDGIITSRGHNLDSDGSCGLDEPGDQPNGNANLGPLADNGGPTPTHELLEGSDAIDAGDGAICGAGPVDGVDQRGVARPQAQSCDIGAFEREFDPFRTVMTAEPALFDLQGGLLGLRLRLLDLSARLVREDNRAPIEGVTVTMTVGRQGGSEEICSAVADADGVATCSGTLSSLLGLVLSGYTATFAGNWQYEPSSASAPLIGIGGAR